MSTQEIQYPSLVTTSPMAVTVLFVLLATVAVSVRINLRIRTTALGADDLMIVAGLLCCWGLLITAIVAAAGGGINFIAGNPLNAAVLFLKIFFVEPLLEFPGLSFVRISVLLFYRRIFSTPTFNRICIFFMVVVALWGLAGVITQLNSARPISRTWSLQGNVEAINFGAWAISMNAIGIALDLVTLSLPLPVIHRLHMKTKHKVLTMCILWLGVFCIVADSVRLYYTVQEVNSALDSSGTDKYALARDVWLWDRITPCASVIAACLPTYGPLLRGRNILESLVRSAINWLSIGTSKPSRTSNRVGQSGESTEADSQKHLPRWERLHDDKGSGSAYIVSENIPLEEQSRMQQQNNGVHVVSTVDLEYSNQARSNRMGVQP